VRRQGFSDAFIRMWEFYLCYCEAAFLERAISDVQVVFTKPQNRMALL
jgi:cyclopropane-fatty-acyl-phospholipid synthase